MKFGTKLNNYRKKYGIDEIGENLTLEEAEKKFLSKKEEKLHNKYINFYKLNSLIILMKLITKSKLLYIIY